jgi:GGDEF domain-containing protein
MQESGGGETGTWLTLLERLAAPGAEPLLPRPDPACALGYAYPEAQAVLGMAADAATVELERLADLGLLEREFARRVHLCEQCAHHTLNFSEDCPSCASANVEIGDLIHHFRCGHTGPEFSFQDGVRYVCPKCSHQLRHIGIDYERPARSYLCRACTQVFVEPRVSCECLRCGARFDAARAIRRQVSAYRASARGVLAAARGELGQTANGGGIIDPAFGVHSFAYFEARLAQEFSASRRHRRALSLLLVDDRGPAASERPDAARQLQQLADAARESLRDSDCAAFCGNSALAVILADTDVEGAGRAATRLADTVRQRFGAPAVERLVFATATLAEQDAGPRSLFERVRAEVAAGRAGLRADSARS